MDCTRVTDLLPDYSVEALDARTHRAVSAHVAGCEGCREELHALESVVVLVEQYGLRQPPPGLFNGVRNRIEAGQFERERPVWWAWLYSRPARGLAMGMAMSAVVLGLLMPAGPPSVPDPLPGPVSMASEQDGGAARSELASAIRQHALSAAGAPLTDRVAWEAMAQMAAVEQAGLRERKEEKPSRVK